MMYDNTFFKTTGFVFKRLTTMLHDSAPPWTQPSTQDLDDQHAEAQGIRTRRNSYRSPYASPVRPPRPPGAGAQASSPDLDVIPETEAQIPEAQPPVDPEDEDASQSPIAMGNGRRDRTPFSWTDGGDEKLNDRNLKLAQGVLEAKAYDCPHGTMEARWRQVVAYLKSNNSRLFALLEGEDTTSWRRVRMYWAGDTKKCSDGLYLEWERAMRRRANTSGAAENHTEFDDVMENIKKAIRDGAGRQTKKRKNSYGVDDDTVFRINRALSGSLGDTTFHAAGVRTVQEIQRAQNQGTIRDGVVQPEPEREPQAPEERKRRGKKSMGVGEIVDSLKASATAQAEVQKLEIDARIKETEAKAKQAENQNQIALRQIELQERRLEQERVRDERRDAATAEQAQTMGNLVNAVVSMVDKIAQKL